MKDGKLDTSPSDPPDCCGWTIVKARLMILTRLMIVAVLAIRPVLAVLTILPVVARLVVVCCWWRGWLLPPC